MSSIIVNLALLIFTLTIIVVGVQFLLLPENRALIKKNKDQLVKTSNYWLKRSSAVSQNVIEPVSNKAKIRFKTPPTQFEKELTGQLIKALKTTFRAILKIFQLFIIASILIFLGYYIFSHARKENLTQIFKSPKNIISGIEDLLNRTTTPLIEPILRKFLD